MEALSHPAFTAGPLTTQGTEPISANFTLAAGLTYLLEVGERDNDARVEILDSAGQLIARADHPERRTGTRRAVVAAPAAGSLTVRVTGKESGRVAGAAVVRVFDLDSIKSPQCLSALKSLAGADASYAAGQEVSSGRAAPAGQSARDAYQHAADGYAAAEQALAAADDAQLRGETELALAGLNYLELQDWTKAADWAKAAAATLGPIDPYRQARAEGLLAMARIQLGSVASGGLVARLSETRALLLRLSRFHMQRGERYDAATQLTNIGLTYLYEGNYPQCITWSAAASRLFISTHEPLRAAVAWQNRALCLWGLGRLAEARDWFVRSLGEIGPQPYPRIYLGSLTNAALLEFDLGNYDESLRRYDRALAFAEQTQSTREAAYCLYGIGVNYRALGDPERARDFLERSLVIRTAALDGRARMDSLRALAIVDAGEGRVEEAIRYDREALTLAVDPLASEGIRVLLAAHTASIGRLSEAKSMLDEVLEKGPQGDQLILATALVQRAVVLRSLGQSDPALSDLGRALKTFHALSSVTQEFAANLEFARTLRAQGRTADALAAVERALALGDAVRMQSVNPVFRVQLQAPLRAAYDLKVELLRAQFDAAVASGHSQVAPGLAARAFAAADSSRARSFADASAQRYSPALRRELAPELRRREALYHDLAERRFSLDYLEDTSAARNPRARRLLSDIAELQRQADALNTLIARRASRPGATLQRRSGGLPSVPAHTAIVSYWLGSESAYAWVVSPGQVHWVRLAPPAAIAQRAMAFHDSLTRLVDRSLEQRLADSAHLSELVIGPLEPWLSQVDQWVVIPDGALDYVSFAALQESASPQSFVVLRRDVALTPAAWMLGAGDSAPRSSPSQSLLLVADPVYQADDPRLRMLGNIAATRADSPLPDARDYRRLPYTADEAASIRREFLPAEVDELIGLDATRDRLLSADLSKYRYIHIAAHGSVDTRVPELSALLLGFYDVRGNRVDGAVRVPDLELQTLRAEVAVFSACDTALGKEVASEGLVGISSTVLARGARAVVASLWPVSDEIGAKLMTEFYRHLLRDSMSAPAALAAAMRSVVSRESAADPALWAAYQVFVVALGPGRPSRNGVTDSPTTTTKGGSL
jgi:CHAT domain-containing protein